MEVKPAKTIRFAQAVKLSGKPRVVTLWTHPKANRDFMKAVRESRVMTLLPQNTGSKKDYGLVGFFQQPHVSFLVFPKPLPYPLETKVVGIKYDLLAESTPEGPLHKPPRDLKPGIAMRETVRSHAHEPENKAPAPTKATHNPKPPKSRPAAKPEPALHHFRARIELSARQSANLEVSATSTAEAARLLRKRAAEFQLDLSTAKITRKLGRPNRV